MDSRQRNESATREDLFREIDALRAELEESRSAHERLRELEQRLRAVIEHVPVVVFATDPLGVITLSEGRGLQPLGLKPGQAVGVSVFEFYKDHHDISRDMRACLNGELVISQVRANGLVWETMYVPKTSSDGEVVGMAAVALDVTARVHAEEKSFALEQDMRERQKMEMLGTLAGGIAHDFNNILSPILGYADLALGALPPDHSARADVDQICRAARRARELVNQILIVARRDDQPKAPVRLRQVVQEALTFLRSMVPANVAIEQDVEAADDLIVGNATQVHQVVSNIALNSFHAMRETGGVFRVVLRRCTHDAGAASRLGVTPGPFLVLSLADQGEGIDEETTARIFEPFFTTKRKSGGTGLGLSVVHGIVHGHGGAIEVESVQGEGTTMRIHFPAGSLAPLDNPTDEPASDFQGSGRVLILDDEPLIVSFLHRLLEQLGFQVTGFTVPEQALVHFQRDPHAFALVFTDRSMPRMTGFDVARTIKQIRPDLPIVLISGLLGPEPAHDLTELFSGVIRKPFDSTDAIRVIHQVLQGTTSKP